MSTKLTETPLVDAQAVTGYGEGGIESSYGFRCVPIADAREIELMLTKALAALSAAEQRAEAMGRDAEVGAAIQRAAGSLPEGFCIELQVERGAGAVKLFYPEGEWDDMDVDGDNRFAAEINAATDAAIASGAGESGNG